MSEAKKQYIVVNACCQQKEDVYAHGCDPDSSRDCFFDHFVGIKFSTIQELAAETGLLDDAKCWGVVDDGRINFQRMEDKYGGITTVLEVELWKKGKLRLWLANYSFYIVEATEPKAEDIAFHLGIELI